MLEILISPRVQKKLDTRHKVTAQEVHQCFMNRTGKLLTDNRDQHQTDPATRWFIAPTNKGRLLKVCYVPDGDFCLRTCYEPNAVELAIYRKHGTPADF